MSANFNRTKTAAAVATALLAALSMSPASAVNVSNDELGDAGFSAYYTVRGGQQTNISLVNTSNDYVVAVKLRFHEFANSRDVRDFNIFLSPNDVWVGTVGLRGSTPFIQTTDLSCTSPGINAAPYTANNAANRQIGFVQVGKTATGNPIKEMDFTAAAYTGAQQDSTVAALTTIVRAQEGYIEVIEMGVARPVSGSNPTGSLLASYAVNSTINCTALNAVYSGTATILVTGSGLAPRRPPQTTSPALDCQGPNITTGEELSGVDAFSAEFCEPLNVLKVASNLVRANSAINMGVPVATLANFYNPGDTGTEDYFLPVAGDLMREPASDQPNLTDATPQESIQVLNGLPAVAAFDPTSFRSGVDAVSSLFMAQTIMNEYRAAASGAPQTAWNVMFPTKGYYVDKATYPDILGTAPFPTSWSRATASCVAYDFYYVDRDEKSINVPLPPSPWFPGTSSTFCYEAQSLNFTNNGNLFGAQPLANSFKKLVAGYVAGWAELDFTGNNGAIFSGAFPLAPIPAPDAYTFRGLPVFGFSLTAVPNGTVTAAYTTPHAYTRSAVIVLPAP